VKGFIICNKVWGVDPKEFLEGRFMNGRGKRVVQPLYCRFDFVMENYFIIGSSLWIGGVRGNIRAIEIFVP